VIVDAGQLDPYDARAASLAFAAAFRELKPDLVLTGVQTPTDLFGQGAPYLAAVLDWPQANVVDGVEVVDGSVHVTQEYSGGHLAVLSLELPAVVGVQSASSPPRYVSMARLRQAMTEASTETLHVDVPAPTQASKVEALARPEHTAGAQMLEGDPEQLAMQIAALLREQGALVS
jgi:electron transfer flavoprotein beta subunit